MKQPDLFAAPTPERTVDDDRPRDLFGNPIDGPRERAPTYRPRKPVQQVLDLNPDAFNLEPTS